jgi:hypothetical protein
VLVHGYGASAVHWRYQVPALEAAGYRVFAREWRRRPLAAAMGQLGGSLCPRASQRTAASAARPALTGPDPPPSRARVPAVCLLGFGWSEKALTEYSSGGLWADQLGDFIKEVVQRPRGGGEEGGAAAEPEPVVLAGNSLVGAGGRRRGLPEGAACGGPRAPAPAWAVGTAGRRPTPPPHRAPPTSPFPGRLRVAGRRRTLPRPGERRGAGGAWGARGSGMPAASGGAPTCAQLHTQAPPIQTPSHQPHPRKVRGLALLNAAGPLKDPSEDDPAADVPDGGAGAPPQRPWHAPVSEAAADLAKRVVLWFAFQRARQPARIRQVLEMVYTNDSSIDEDLVESIRWAGLKAARVFGGWV